MFKTGSGKGFKSLRQEWACRRNLTIGQIKGIRTNLLRMTNLGEELLPYEKDTIKDAIILLDKILDNHKEVRDLSWHNYKIDHGDN